MVYALGFSLQRGAACGRSPDAALLPGTRTHHLRGRLRLREGCRPAPLMPNADRSCDRPWLPPLSVSFAVCPWVRGVGGGFGRLLSEKLCHETVAQTPLGHAGARRVLKVGVALLYVHCFPVLAQQRTRPSFPISCTSICVSACVTLAFSVAAELGLKVMIGA